MKKYFLILIALALVSGCIGSAPPNAQTNWAIEFSRGGERSEIRPDKSLPSIKIASVNIRAPWDGTRLAVMRKDGSVAFDPFNTFAAAPQIMLRGVAQDSLEATGRFSNVIASSSSAAADYSAEIIVPRLALDCREENMREATCEIMLTILEGRKIVATSRGEAASSTDNGDYSAAFSKAFRVALQKAARSAMDEIELRVKED